MNPDIIEGDHPATDSEFLRYIGDNVAYKRGEKNRMHNIADHIERMEAALVEYADHASWYKGQHGGLEVVFDSFDSGKHGYELAEEALGGGDG
jgi:hypothetical protein